MWPKSNVYSNKGFILDAVEIYNNGNYKSPDLNSKPNVIPRVNRLLVTQNGSPNSYFPAYEVIGGVDQDINKWLDWFVNDQSLKSYYGVIMFPKNYIEGRLEGPGIKDWGSDFIIIGLKPSSQMLAKLIKENKLLRSDSNMVLENVVYIPTSIVKGFDRLVDRRSA